VTNHVVPVKSLNAFLLQSTASNILIFALLNVKVPLFQTSVPA
jgi:hypothetical protein